MRAVLIAVLVAARSTVRSRAELEVEILRFPVKSAI
jgi:hypothetical protein